MIGHLWNRGTGVIPPSSVCFVPDFGRNPYQTELARGLRVHGMEVVFFQHVGEALKARLLGKTRIDVVHLHWLPRVQPGIRGAASAVLFVARVRLLALSGCKIVWTVHNVLPHETVSPKHELRIRRTIARIANKIIVHSPSAVPIVAEAFGVDVLGGGDRG